MNTNAMQIMNSKYEDKKKLIKKHKWRKYVQTTTIINNRINVKLNACYGI